MKKISAIIVFSMLSLTAFGKELSQDEKEKIYEASNYGLCQELKLRPPKGDENLIQVNCPTIISIFELKMEKASLQKRLIAIELELKKALKSKVELD